MNYRTIKAVKLVKRSDYIGMAKKALLVLAILIVGYGARVAHEGFNERTFIAEAEQRLLNIEESFADGRPFMAFGKYRIWPATGKIDLCFTKARERKEKR